MKLNLVLLALLQQALSAQHPMDPARLELALKTPHLNAWMESIATKHNISKDAVRSNVQAMTFHLEPESEKDPVGKEEDPGSAAGGAGHAMLDRRQVLLRDYPHVYGNESQNDPMTNNRLAWYHDICSSTFAQPADSPYQAFGADSFWRGIRGACRRRTRLRILCRLPNEFGPQGWRYHIRDNLRETAHTCAKDEECTIFRAHNFGNEEAASWPGCTKKEKTDKQGMVNSRPGFMGLIKCPLSPGTMRTWDGYAQSDDGNPINWALFTGFQGAQLLVAKSADFLFGRPVQWRGLDPDYQPWLKFARERATATIHLYSHVFEVK